MVQIAKFYIMLKLQCTTSYGITEFHSGYAILLIDSGVYNHSPLMKYFGAQND